MSQLAGKRIIVSGAGRGLGRAFAEACCAEGASVVVAELESDLGQATSAALRDAGHDAQYEFVDIGDPGAIEALAARLGDGDGAVDGLINNAARATGIGGKAFDEIDIETWDQVQRINVRGTWLMVKALTPLLRRARTGRIVNLASDTALWGAPALLHYVASKGAIISMTRSLARELGPDGITINAIAPGIVRVEATEYVPRERHELYERQRAIPRAQFPDDVTGLATFLLSDAAGFLTGQTIPANGGFVFN